MMFRRKTQVNDTERKSSSWRARGKDRKKVSSTSQDSEKDPVKPLGFSILPTKGNHHDETRNDMIESKRVGQESRNSNHGGLKNRWSRTNKEVPKETEVTDQHDNTPVVSSSKAIGSFPLRDVRQMKLVVKQFGSDPKEAIQIIKENGVPSPESREHVLVRVEVRFFSAFS